MKKQGVKMLGGAEQATIEAISAEVFRARLKFPNGTDLLPALMEEVGELSQALLQGRPKDEVEKEAVQVACLAVRIIEEGVPEFALRTLEQKQR